MKIAFVVSQFPTLSESFVVQQIAGLLKRGHEVHIFAFSSSGQFEVQREVEEYSLLEKTTYIILPKRKWLLRLKGAWGILNCFCHFPIAATKLLKMFFKRRFFSYPQVFLLPFLIKEKFDIVHAHFGPNGIHSMCLKNVTSQTRLLTSFHGYDVTSYVSRNGNCVYQPLFKLGDKFTYNSEATKQKLLGLGCPENKMEKLPMGIDLKRIPFKERNRGTDETIRLLSIGRLVEMKGREYAIKAVACLRDKYPIQYDILGDGPLKMDLQELIEALGVDPVVKLHGWVSSKMLEKMYSEAHLFIHPSVTSSDGNQEGQGVVLLEAQAHGIPVIATRHGAFPDSVQDGKTAFLVPEKDVQALTATIEQLIQNAGNWPEIGRSGRSFVARRFDSKHLNERLIEIYEQILINSV